MVVSGAAVGVSAAAPSPQPHPSYSQAPGVELFEVAGTGDFRGVACPYDGTCVVTGVSTSGPNETGVVVPIVEGKPGDVQSVGGTSEVFGVACGSADECVGVGFDGNTGIGQVVPINQGVPGGPRSIDGSGSLFGVDCILPTTCMLAGEDTNLQHGVAVAYDTGAPRTQTVGSRNMWQADCPIPNDCLVVGEGGTAPNGAGILVQTHDGSVGATQTAGGVAGLFDIDCMTPTSCLAVGANPKGVGQLIPYTDGQLRGPTPVANTIPLHGIACMTSSTCIAVGRLADPPQAAYVVVTDGVPGQVHGVPGTSQFEDVACGAPDWCVAVGNVGGQTGVIAEIELTGADAPTTSPGTDSFDPFEELLSLLPELIFFLGGLGILIGVTYLLARILGLLPNLNGDPVGLVELAGMIVGALKGGGGTGGSPGGGPSASGSPTGTGSGDSTGADDASGSPGP
jgi:hypothetical protein